MRQAFPLVTGTEKAIIGEALREDSGLIVLVTFNPPFDVIYRGFASNYDYVYQEAPEPHVVMTEHKLRKRIPVMVEHGNNGIPWQAGWAIIDGSRRISAITWSRNADELIRLNFISDYDFEYDPAKGESVIARRRDIALSDIDRVLEKAAGVLQREMGVSKEQASRAIAALVLRGFVIRKVTRDVPDPA